MSWQDRFQQQDDVVRARIQDGPTISPARLVTRAEEMEVRSVLQGLSRRHGLTVGEVARNLESGLWSRENCLGAMRLQWTFEKMCDGKGFPEKTGRVSVPKA